MINRFLSQSDTMQKLLVEGKCKIQVFLLAICFLIGQEIVFLSCSSCDVETQVIVLWTLLCYEMGFCGHVYSYVKRGKWIN